MGETHRAEEVVFGGELERLDQVLIDEAALYEQVVAIIENRKYRAGSYANREITLMFGKSVNTPNQLYSITSVLSMVSRLCRRCRHNWLHVMAVALKYEISDG